MSILNSFRPKIIRDCPKCENELNLLEVVPGSEKIENPKWYGVSDRQTPRICPFCDSKLGLEPLSLWPLFFLLVSLMLIALSRESSLSLAIIVTVFLAIGVFGTIKTAKLKIKSEKYK